MAWKYKFKVNDLVVDKRNEHVYTVISRAVLEQHGCYYMIVRSKENKFVEAVHENNLIEEDAVDQHYDDLAVVKKNKVKKKFKKKKKKDS